MNVTPLASPVPTGAVSLDAAAPADDAFLRETARDFEAVFVRQMLQHAGLAEAFGSGEGPSADAFSGFLLDAVAEKLVDGGGFGLAEQFYAAMGGGRDGDDAGKKVTL